MIYTFVLIVVLGFNTSQTGAASISTQFTSAERCENARRQIVADAKRAKEERYLYGSTVVTANCYPI